VKAAIPLADTPALRPRARVTLAVRLALAATVLGCVVAFLLASTNPNTRTVVPLPAHTNGVLVLDLSASISSDSFSRIGGTLQALSGSHRRFGLVIFSGVAYEALPPGTPAADLAPLVRYFTLPPQRTPGFLPSFPPNPWATTFTGGTNISSGMQLAYQIAVAQRHRAAVILVSDLDDSPGDVPALAAVLGADRRAGVPVRIIGLNPAPSDVAFFQTALGPQTPVTEAPLLNAAPPRNLTPFPWLLVVLTVAAAIVLGLHTAWLPRLDWGGSSRPHEAGQ
jgi:hypothetical protein